MFLSAIESLQTLCVVVDCVSADQLVVQSFDTAAIYSELASWALLYEFQNQLKKKRMADKDTCQILGQFHQANL